MAAPAPTSNPTSSSERLDAVIVGGGLAGVRQLAEMHRRGLSVALIERGGGLGGTWYYNRYPGARTDSDSYSYGFYFAPELAEEWSWPEHYASQADIERYLNWIVDRFGMRDSVRLGSTVTAATFDEQSPSWSVTLANGDVLEANHLILATGMLSHPIYPTLPGLDAFEGVTVHTGWWPEEGVDFTGKRVALFGTGSSGIQIAPEIAERAAGLTVFQRTGHWATPLNNRPFTAEEQEDFRRRFDEVFASRQSNPAGQAFHEFETRSVFEVTDQERIEKFDTLYERTMGLKMLAENFRDVMFDPAANKLWSDYLAERIRRRVADPDLARRLTPSDHGFGKYRPPKDNGYYEIFNEPHVELVSLRETPVVQVTAGGIETTDGELPFDIIVFATGFEAWLGALKQIDIRGAGGISLREAWADGPHTTLGMAAPGFPNMFFNGGAHAVGSNTPAFAEVHAPWICSIIEHARSLGSERIETTSDAADTWTEHVYACAAAAPEQAEGAWYSNGNVEGSPGKMLVYMGGLPNYVQMAEQERVDGFGGFTFSRQISPQPDVETQVGAR